MRSRGFFGALGWLLVRLRFAVVLFWAAVALAAYLYLPALGDSTSSSLADVVPESAPAARAEAQAEGLAGSVEAPAILVYSNPEGFSGPDLDQMAYGVQRLNEGPGRLYGLRRAVPLAAQNPSNPTRVDRDLLGDEALPVLLYFEPGTRLTEIATGVGEIREDLGSPGPLRTSATGIRLVQHDTKIAIEGNLVLVTVVTTLAIFLVVALAYRSLVAPLIPLASIGLATFLTLRVLGWVAAVQGVSIPAQIEPIIVVLLFGVGTDYALFLLSRTRQALEEGTGRLEAARVGVEKVGGILLSSAAVLIAAFALLVLADLGLYRALGPGLALALCIVFAVTLTLVPALLAVLGPAAFGRRSLAPRRDPSRRPAFRRAGPISVVLVAGLVVASAGNLGLKVGFDQLANLPESATSVRGYEELTGEFPGGVLAPVNVLVRGEDLDEKNEELLRLQTGMQSELLDAGGSALTFGPQYAGRVPEIDFVSPDGSAARVLLVFYGPPFSPEALDQARGLQERLPVLLDEAGLEDATGVVGGQTALSAAARDTSEDDLKKVAPLLFAVSFVVLALLLRTPVAPVYLLISTALSFTATMGVCALLFQNVFGQDGVVYYVPFTLFLLLVALGSDYNIFIMAAVREEAEGRPLKEAVPAALARTGPTINAAGLALAASFLALTLIPLQDFFQVGVAVALGVLLDAFVIRTLLVPALVLLVGPAGFWPAKVRP
ncbi:MMPL family transporter [Rubrobacter tropicus]|uniref:MMPL family transporter n=1 Tax=Rubrobacter tropicus TaxID=2653851 RepID=A0A6G8QAT0_9ACTN|nr:MMPL family transporter [Rubrobacter tropicus]QIN83569.1 MMPL family transporter [Rubrobacter tropicus]